MKLKLFALLLALSLLAAAAMAVEFNVKDYGAVGDGKTDNTQAFQKALDDAGKALYGTVVVDNGNYLFKGHLTMPVGVTLKGTRASVPSNNGIRDKGLPLPTEGGSTLMPTENRGNEKGDPFILMNTNCTVQGFVFYYPDQETEKVPAAYPWTVAMRGKNPALLDCELLNPYNGIDASKNERQLVRNISGQPLRRGIFTDEIYDIGRWENIHWNPWYSMKGDLWDFQLTQGEGFILGKSDWHYVLNTFAYGYAIGYRFIDNGHGTTNGQLMGAAADGCHVSVQVDSASGLGVLITNGQFVAMFKDDPVMVRIKDTNKGAVMFQNCSFWGPCKNNVVMEGGELTLQNCNFVNWGGNDASVDIKAGNAIISACRFQDKGVPVKLGGTANGLIFADNIIKSGKKIQRSVVKAKVEEHNNIYGLPK